MLCCAVVTRSDIKHWGILNELFLSFSDVPCLNFILNIFLAQDDGDDIASMAKKAWVFNSLSILCAFIVRECGSKL